MIDSYDWVRFIDLMKGEGRFQNYWPAVPREPEGRGNAHSWEMIPLCKRQMEMTLGQPPDRNSLGLFLVRRDDDCEGLNNETILIKEVLFLKQL